MARVKRFWRVMYNVIVMPERVMGAAGNHGGVHRAKKIDSSAASDSHAKVIAPPAPLGRGEAGPR